MQPNNANAASANSTKSKASTASNAAEKEKALQQALSHTFTVDELKERLKNNKIDLFLDFLKKLKVEVSQTQRQNPQVVLQLLTRHLVTQEGKTQASKILGLNTFRELYTAKKAVPQNNAALNVPNILEVTSIQQREELVQNRQKILVAQERQQFIDNQIVQAQQAQIQMQVQAQAQAQAIAQQQAAYLQTNLMLQKQQSQQKIQNRKQTQQHLMAARQQAMLHFSQVMASAQKSTIFNILYEQLALQSKPGPFFAAPNDNCLCGRSANEIQCQHCHKSFHKLCVHQSQKMKQFMCPGCQLYYMDPISVPVMTLVEPFLVYRGASSLAEDGFPEVKNFEFKDNARQLVLQTTDISVQLRCIQLGETLIHQMPKFGSFRLSGDKRTLQVFKIPDPPNDRKRKDKILDLTNWICRDLTAKNNSQYQLELIHRPKHAGDDKLFYVAGLFICKTFPVQDIVNYVECLQPRIWFQETFEKIKKWNQAREEDDLQVATKVIKVSLTCKMSMCEMRIPVKGQWCDHYECFDLTTYLESNAKAKAWKCPVCPQDKPILLYKDEFMMALIEAAGKGETEAEIDYETLQVRFSNGSVVYKLTPDGLDPQNQEAQQLQLETQTQTTGVSSSFEDSSLRVPQMLGKRDQPVLPDPQSQQMLMLQQYKRHKPATLPQCAPVLQQNLQQYQPQQIQSPQSVNLPFLTQIQQQAVGQPTAGAMQQQFQHQMAMNSGRAHPQQYYPLLTPFNQPMTAASLSHFGQPVSMQQLSQLREAHLRATTATQPFQNSFTDSQIKVAAQAPAAPSLQEQNKPPGILSKPQASGTTVIELD